MAKAVKPKKASKQRANKYEQKLRIKGSFEDLVKALVTPNNPTKKK